MSDDGYSDDNYQEKESDDEEMSVPFHFGTFKPIVKPPMEYADDSEIDSDPDSSSDDEEEEEEEEEPDDDKQLMKGGDGDGEEDGDDEDDDDEEEEDKEEHPGMIEPHIPSHLSNNAAMDSDSDDDEYLQKFDHEITKQYIYEQHPECLNHNQEEIQKLSKVSRDENRTIHDPLHKTIPLLTKYERTRILGIRSKQIENGAIPFVQVPEEIIDSAIIAEMELKDKKIPFIIRREVGNAFEYWNVGDLEDIL
jgi:DNA-directed RNA polymerase subunit K/omega